MRSGAVLQPAEGLTSKPVGPTRRDLCRGLVLASCVPFLGAGIGGCARFRSRRDGRGAALLLPMTGQDSALGQNMARAASLVVQDSADGQLPAFDTKDTAEGASAAAAQALAGGARMLLGPLRADQTPAVLAMAGGVPVVARLEGTNVDQGKAILAQSGLAITAADDLSDAAAKAVAAIKENG
jgi:outer membrane PBP1 activator LpoA protein